MKAQWILLMCAVVSHHIIGYGGAREGGRIFNNNYEASRDDFFNWSGEVEDRKTPCNPCKSLWAAIKCCFTCGKSERKKRALLNQKQRHTMLSIEFLESFMAVEELGDEDLAYLQSDGDDGHPYGDL